MKPVFEIINHILADWNPIGVPKDIAIEEYKEYIPLILQATKDRHELMNCLEDILINKMEIEYNAKNEAHSKDLEKICDKIIHSIK